MRETSNPRNLTLRTLYSLSGNSTSKEEKKAAIKGGLKGL